MRRLGSLALVVATVVGLLTACGSSKDNTDGYVSNDGMVTTIDPAQRKKAPIIEGTDLNGKQISTADYAGKVLVVNLWGSWCPPCRKEAPLLAEVSKADSSSNVQFLGLLSDDNSSSAKAFAEQTGMDYPSINDDDGSRQLAYADVMPAPGLPTTWIIDAKGRMAARYAGPIPSKVALTDLIDYVKKTS